APPRSATALRAKRIGGTQVLSPSAPFRGRNGRLKNSGEICWASSLNGIFAFCDPPSNFRSRSSIIKRLGRVLTPSNAKIAGEIPAGSANYGHVVKPE